VPHKQETPDLTDDFAEGLSAKRLVKFVELARRLVYNLIENISRCRLVLSV